jgi:hypothetical protein
VACKLDSERSQKCRNKNDRAGARFHVSNETKSNRFAKLSRGSGRRKWQPGLPVFELARVLVRFDHVARIIVNGWQVYEAPRVQPVFLSQDEAIDHATCRACFRSGEIRILDSTGKVERTIHFSEADRRL